jgi:hypothetical protein
VRGNVNAATSLCSSCWKHCATEALARCGSISTQATPRERRVWTLLRPRRGAWLQHTLQAAHEQVFVLHAGARGVDAALEKGAIQEGCSSPEAGMHSCMPLIIPLVTRNSLLMSHACHFALAVTALPCVCHGGCVSSARSGLQPTCMCCTACPPCGCLLLGCLFALLMSAAYARSG